MTVKSVREMLISNLIDNGSTPAKAKNKVNAIADTDLLVAVVSAGLNDPDDELEIESETVAVDDEKDADMPVTGFVKPQIINVIGTYLSHRSFIIKDEAGEEVLDKDGNIREVCVMSIQPIQGKIQPVFITPKQLTGFSLNVGKFVDVMVEVRRSHVTQYQTAQKEVKFHGKPSDIKGKVELAFVTGNTMRKQTAVFDHLLTLPVDDRDFALKAIMALESMAD